MVLYIYINKIYKPPVKPQNTERGDTNEQNQDEMKYHYRPCSIKRIKSNNPSQINLMIEKKLTNFSKCTNYNSPCMKEIL